MKKIILFLTLLTFVYLSPKILKLENCQVISILRKVKIFFNELASLKVQDLIPFNLELKNENSNQIVNAYCYIEKFINKKTRNSYCYILSEFLDDQSRYTISKINSKYKLDKKNFSFRFNECKYSGNNKPIFFKQVNNFSLIDNKGIFMFYAITQDKNYAPSSITFLANITYENNAEIKEANCSINSPQDKSPIISQIAYKCEIEGIDINKFKFLRILDSDDISGIPYDYNNIFIDPFEDQEVIQEGSLVNGDGPNHDNNLTIFNINKIQCLKNKGILSFNGILNGEIKERKNFTIFLSYLHKYPSGCIIPASNSGKEVNIECILFDDISIKNYLAFEAQILSNGKDGILLNYESKQNEIECEAMNINLNLTYKDINSFKLENRKIKFEFIGHAEKSTGINNSFILYLDLIYKDTKEKKLSSATCTQNATVNLENNNEVNFICEILVDNETIYSSIILSPYNYHIGNISNYEIPINPIIIDLPHKFNSNIIKFSNCPELKNFTINGIFDGIINDAINFELEGIFQLKYSSNCTLYKNPEDKAEIHCVINNNFLSKFELHALNDQINISNIDLINNIKCINKTDKTDSSEDDISNTVV